MELRDHCTERIKEIQEELKQTKKERPTQLLKDQLRDYERLLQEKC